MASRPTEEVPAITLAPRKPGGRIISGPGHLGRRIAQQADAPAQRGLQVRDLESGGGESTIVGCSSVFLRDQAYGEFLQNGGRNYSGANVELIFWGSAWLAPGASPTPGEVTAAVRTIFNSSYFYPLKQYGVNVGKLDQSFTVTSPEPPNNVSSGDIESMLWDLVGGKFPLPDQPGGRNIYVVFLPSTTTSTPTPGYNSAHNQTWHIHVDLPFDPVDVEWVYYAWIGPAGGLDAATYDFSHEVVETYTNPDTHDDDGWVINFGSDPQELADVCATTQAGTIDGVTVTPYFSRFDNACIIPGGESLRLFLSTNRVNGATCLRRLLPPGECLREWMNS